MRASVASLSKKLLSTFFAATLAFGFAPATAFAELAQQESAPIDAMGGASEAQESGTAYDPSMDASENTGSSFAAPDDAALAEGDIPSEGEALFDEEMGSAVVLPAGAIINQELPLDSVVAQAESTRTFFLAQTLESARGIPMVSAKLPIDKGGSVDGAELEQGDGEDGAEEGGEDSDEPDLGFNGVSAESTVVGSFTSGGLTYAIEPGGESVAVVAADYGKLPSEQASENILAIPPMVSADGADAYSVTRIADGAFSGLTEQAAGASATREETSGSFDEEATSLDPSVEGEGAEGAEELEGSEGQESFVGIVALGIPASVSSIEDGAFSGSDTLQYLVVSDDNPTYASFDGALYSADLATLRLIPEGRVGAVRIASNATDVDPEVFSHCPLVDAAVADADSAAYKVLEKESGLLVTEDSSETEMSRLARFDALDCSPYMAISSRATYADWKYYESVYTFVGCRILENTYVNGVIQGPAVEHIGAANGYVYGRFGGDRIHIYRNGSMQYVSLIRNNVAYDYFDWGSTEVGKYVTQKLYWDRELTRPVSEGAYYQDMDLFLGWGYTNYTLAFNANGGSGSIGSAANLTVNTTVIMPQPGDDRIKKTGYRIIGWSVNGHTYSPGQKLTMGTLAVEAGRPAQASADTVTVSAQWAPNTYTIAYNANGGAVSGGTTSYNIESNNFTLPTSGTRTGYTFAGWDVTGASGAGIAGNGTANVTIKKGTYGNLTATAKWIPVEYSISWDTAGGTLSGQKTSYNIETADYALPAPTRTGYTFAGWEVTGASGAGAAGNGTTSVTIKRGTYGSLTAKAKWSLNAYLLSWDVSHGSHANRTEDFTVEDCPIAMGEATPDEGYAFTGWSGEKLSASPSSFTLDASFLEGKADGTTLSFTAGFSANPYTIHLHANDGTGAGGLGDTLEHAVTYDAAVADAEVPKRYGYAFSGYWTKNADGTRAELYFDADGAYVKDTVWKGLSDVDLYACWTLMGDLEVPISSPSTLSFAFDRATGQACSSDGSSSSYGLIRSSMPEEVPVASVALEALRGPDGTSVPEKLLGKGNPEECAMEVVFSAGASSSKTALLRFASPAGSAEDETLWEFPSTDRPLIPSATSVASGTTGDDIVTDGLGNLARAGELSLSYALKTLPGFDVYEVPLADASEDAARIVFTVDLTGVAQERF